MKLDVSELLKKQNVVKKLNFQLEDKMFYDGSEPVIYGKPVSFDGSLNKVGNIITLNGDIDTELKLTCSRCLEKFKYDISISIEEKISNNSEANKDEDIIFIDSDTIDITEVIENNIIANLPIKKLCKEDCKGLCQYCGTDLNVSTCNCNNDDIDPRLAKLKDLFSTD